MDRTSAANYADIGSGRRGYRNRDLMAGVRGTTNDAADRNAAQEELVGIEERAGLVPNGANWAQVRQALDRLYGGGLRGITADATLTADDSGQVSINANGGAINLTLMAANSVGGRPIPLDLIRVDGSANAVLVYPAGADLIESSATPIAIPPRGRVRLRGDGATNWIRTGRGLPLVDDATFKFLPFGGQVAPRGLSFIAPCRGLVHAYSQWFCSDGAQPGAILNELEIEGVSAISESTTGGSFVASWQLVERGTNVNVDGRLTVDVAGGTFVIISHRIGWIFVPEVG